ncbi:Phosphate acyltransferase [Bienertia sinuspersici]
MTFALLLKAVKISLHFSIHLMMLRKDLKKGDISFFIGGVNSHMCLKQVNELFEFPIEGTIGPDSFKSFCEGVGDKGFVANHFWKEVTGRSDTVVGFTKSFSFVNPVICLLHLLLLHVFYPKGETG